MHKHAERLSEKKVLVMIAISAVAGLLLSLADIGHWGYVVILILYAGEHLLYPFMSEIINYHTTDKQRATVLSVASFLRTLPYVILAPTIGYLNTIGKLNYFLIGWAVVIIISVFIYLSKKRTDDKIKLEV
jgi:membrane protein DedA with SNARE-associated domain